MSQVQFWTLEEFGETVEHLLDLGMLELFEDADGEVHMRLTEAGREYAKKRWVV